MSASLNHATGEKNCRIDARIDKNNLHREKRALDERLIVAFWHNTLSIVSQMESPAEIIWHSS